MDFEVLVLSNLLHNDEYNRKVIPFLKPEYFERQSSQLVFKLVDSYFNKYQSFPTTEALSIELDSVSNVSQQTFDESVSVVASLRREADDDVSIEWLIDKTEAWCQDRALSEALRAAIRLAAEEKNERLSKGSIPDILRDALSICFDTNVGHDYLDDAFERWDYYHLKEKRIPFDIDLLNTITNGGITSKTLNVLMAGIGVGKSLCLCHLAASNLMQGLNVLYVTLELKKEEVARRIDANLMDIPVNDINTTHSTVFEKNVERLRQTTKGKLLIKEYPATQISVNHIRALIREIEMKRGIKVDVLYIDYLNLMQSARLRRGDANSYEFVKMIAEEARGLGQELDIPVWSATQVNRSGFSNSDFGMEHTSESFGLPATCDLFLAVISDPNLERLGQFAFKQLKNRLGNINTNTRFIVGVDKPKMRLYNVEQSAQDNLVKDAVVFDNTKTGEDTMSSKFEDWLV